MTETWNFHSAGELLFGPGAVEQVGSRCATLGVRRALVVTDPILAAAGHLEQVQRSLEAAGVTASVFDGGQAEPSLKVVERCIAFARDASPDGLIGLGGGSNMDLAKLTAVVLTHGGHPRQYAGDQNVPGPLLPVICISTTSGTGSEVTPAAVYTDDEQQIKVSTLSNYLRPRVAIVDPLLTLSCPPKVTADSGIDALTHAVEALTATNVIDFHAAPGGSSVYQGRNPLSTAFAEQAIALVGQHLVQACREPQDLRAREGMALAATLAGLAFSNSGVALVHAMEYPVGGAVHCSHGEGNGLLLPYVMRFNLPARIEEMATIARLLGAAATGLDEQQAAGRAIGAVDQLLIDIGIPRRLRELRVTQEQLPGFAVKAFGIKRLMRVNPRQPTLADIEEIYRQAW